MEKVTVLSSDLLFNSFLHPKYIPAGQNKYYLRNTQVCAPKNGWRHLNSSEIETLVKNDNTAMSWDNIMVTDEFDPKMIKNNKFYGFVRIGRVSSDGLQYHDLRLSIGITNSSIHSCDIGDDCAIHNVHYLSHYIIGDRCMLFNIQEMVCTDHAKFGNGIIKEGEEESVRIWLELMNETGCRKVLPFDGMIAADAYMWAKFIDDKMLQDRLKTITQNSFDSRRGFYGTIGYGTVVKNSLIIKDVKIGNCAYIKGASKLKNLTINSSEKEPSQIGENTVLVNGIIGYGCRIFYSVIAVRFVLGSHSNLKYGARLMNSFMGDNSTISCCEVLNNLIFPAHEQHHNNSFLVASVIKGQSNMAAGATIGSNHNSRSNDSEIEAGRGFWSGLCTSVKHSSKFACFTMITKADYPAEIINPFPFSMISNDETKGELQVMPAFTWLYNMYAMARNEWKYVNRDTRIFKIQNIEFEAFAPDSIEEVIESRKLLSIWTAKAWLRKEGKSFENMTDKRLIETGKKLLNGKPEVVKELEVLGENMEKSKRKVVILRPYEAYHAYGDMIVFYAVKNIVKFLEENENENFESLSALFDGERKRVWFNLGGQIMSIEDVNQLRSDIKDGTLNSWKEIHHRYNEIWKRYFMDKLRHAYLSLKHMLEIDEFTVDDWTDVLNRAIDVQNYIYEQVYVTRKKDYDNYFRRATFLNEEEMLAAWGKLDKDSFILQQRKATKEFTESIQNIKKRLLSESSYEPLSILEDRKLATPVNR
jgi:NDP-sugar pyrophosphorylase family protein